MNGQNKLNTELQLLVKNIESLNLIRLDILIGISIKLKYENETELESIKEELAKLGLHEIDDDLTQPGKISVPIIFGKVHPTTLFEIANQSYVEEIKHISRVEQKGGI